MSAIAITLAEMGHDVSGSDFREQPMLDKLRAAGVAVHVGHDRGHVDGVDAVASSTAIPANNNEVDEARKRGIPTLSRAEMLAAICAMAKSIGVAGAHGKTTTTSMLMLVLQEAELRPSFVVGGEVADAGTGASWTGGEWFVVEADESDRTHLELPLYGTILLNIDADLLDHYDSFDDIVDGFDRYLAGIAGPKVLCIDDPHCRMLAARHDVITYGTTTDADYHAVDIEPQDGWFRFVVRTAGRTLGTVDLPLRGRHNVANALGVIAMADRLGVPFDVVRAALARFGGVARRFDVRGVDGGATFVDDYAHLPAEIEAVLAAVRGSGDDWQRVVAVFQPNRFNRMAKMSRDYADSFVDADVVVITEIYPSGTTPIPGVTGQLVVDAIVERHPASRVVWLPRRDDLVSFLAGEVGAGDVCVSMGCGDVASLPDEVQTLRQRRRAEAAQSDFV